MAYELCRRLGRDCADLEVWEPVAEYALSGALRSHRHLGMERGEDWINLALAFLRVCALVEAEQEVAKRQEELQLVLEEMLISQTETTGTSGSKHFLLANDPLCSGCTFRFRHSDIGRCG